MCPANGLARELETVHSWRYYHYKGHNNLVEANTGIRTGFSERETIIRGPNGSF